jgi:hypothetical protein
MYQLFHSYNQFYKSEYEPYEELPSVYFLTFGNNKFKQSLQRIQHEAKQLPFSKVIGYGEDDLKQIPEFWDKHSSFINANERGYGYWLWKPFLTWYTLRTMNEGDILIYADSGSTIYTNYDQFKEIVVKARDSKSGIVSWTVGHIHSSWNKMDLLEHLNANHLLHEIEYHATFFAIRASKETVELTRRWYEIGSNYHLIDDSPSITPNHSSFREHRHDQSIFSLLRHLHGTEVYRYNTFINDSRIRI